MVDDLGASGTPYNPVIVDTYLKGKEPFMPTFYEWLNVRGEKVHIANYRGSAGTSTVYTVPKGYILFMTSAFCSINVTPGVNVSSTAFLSSGNGTDNRILYFITQSPAGTNEVYAQDQNISFLNLPLIFYENEVISITSNDNSVLISGGFTGFTVRKDQIPQI